MRHTGKRAGGAMAVRQQTARELVIDALQTGASVTPEEVLRRGRRLAPQMSVPKVAVLREFDALIGSGLIRDIGQGRFRMVARGGRGLLTSDGAQ